jgi:hypothetical protein
MSASDEHDWISEHLKRQQQEQPTFDEMFGEGGESPFVPKDDEDYKKWMEEKNKTQEDLPPPEVLRTTDDWPAVGELTVDNLRAAILTHPIWGWDGRTIAAEVPIVGFSDTDHILAAGDWIDA